MEVGFCFFLIIIVIFSDYRITSLIVYIVLCFSLYLDQ